MALPGRIRRVAGRAAIRSRFLRRRAGDGRFGCHGGARPRRARRPQATRPRGRARQDRPRRLARPAPVAVPRRPRARPARCRGDDRHVAPRRPLLPGRRSARVVRRDLARARRAVRDDPTRGCRDSDESNRSARPPGARCAVRPGGGRERRRGPFRRRRRRAGDRRRPPRRLVRRGVRRRKRRRDHTRTCP